MLILHRFVGAFTSTFTNLEYVLDLAVQPEGSNMYSFLYCPFTSLHCLHSVESYGHISSRLPWSRSMALTSHISYGFHSPLIHGTHGRTVCPLIRQTRLYGCSSMPHLVESNRFLSRTLSRFRVAFANANIPPRARNSLDTFHVSCLSGGTMAAPSCLWLSVKSFRKAKLASLQVVKFTFVPDMTHMTSFVVSGLMLLM